LPAGEVDQVTRFVPVDVDDGPQGQRSGTAKEPDVRKERAKMWMPAIPTHVDSGWDLAKKDNIQLGRII